MWPINTVTRLQSPTVRIDGEMLIAGATYTRDAQSGTVTVLDLKRPDAFIPEPEVSRDPWAEALEGAE